MAYFDADAEGLNPPGLYPAQQVSSFFCEALLHCDSQGAELLGTALRVCDRTRYFVDREAGGDPMVCRACSSST